MTTLVTIPDCTATHVLGESSVELASGPLALIAADTVHAPSTAHGAASAPPVLTLSVGPAAFPLHKSTLFGTVADDARVYLFTPDLGPGGGQAGYVKITLPLGVEVQGGTLGDLQEEFEKVLVRYGLLKEGVAAVGDELGQSAKETAAAAASSIERAASKHISSTDPTSQPATFSPQTHSFLESSASATGSAASWTKAASNTISDTAASAGAWLGKTVGLGGRGSSGGDVSSAGNSLGNLTDGVKGAVGGAVDGASHLTSAVATQGQTVIEHDYGTDAASLSSKAGETAGNVGSTAGHAIGSTSFLYQGAKSMQGATEGDVSGEAEEQNSADT